MLRTVACPMKSFDCMIDYISGLLVHCGEESDREKCREALRALLKTQERLRYADVAEGAPVQTVADRLDVDVFRLKTPQAIFEVFSRTTTEAARTEIIKLMTNAEKIAKLGTASSIAWRVKAKDVVEILTADNHKTLAELYYRMKMNLAEHCQDVLVETDQFRGFGILLFTMLLPNHGSVEPGRLRAILVPEDHAPNVPDDQVEAPRETENPLRKATHNYFRSLNFYDLMCKVYFEKIAGLGDLPLLIAYCRIARNNDVAYCTAVSIDWSWILRNLVQFKNTQLLDKAVDELKKEDGFYRQDVMSGLIMAVTENNREAAIPLCQLIKPMTEYEAGLLQTIAKDNRGRQSVYELVMQLNMESTQ